MKKNLFLIFILTFCILSCKNDRSKITTDLVTNHLSAFSENSSRPKLFVKEEKFSFGNVYAGEIVEHSFLVKNIGDKDLLIGDAKASCGCTVPKWPKKPLLPDEEAYIEVVFNTSGRSGKQNKTITLLTNAVPNTTVLQIQGNIINKKDSL